MNLTVAELVVLGLVIEQPRHGYDLERTITERGIRQWADVAFSSIYYVLGKLESRAFLHSESGAGSKSRRIYSATDSGRRAAGQATAQALGVAVPSFSPFVVGLANANLLDSTRIRSLACDRRDSLTDQLAQINVARGAQGALPQSAQLVFSYTLAMLVAERDWLTTLINGDASP